MSIETMIDIIDVAWPIMVAVFGGLIFKLYPMLKTRIHTTEYYNLFTTYILVQYELIGSVVAQIITCFLAVAVGKSTWETLYYREYCIAWGIVTVLYLFGIGLVLKKQIEKPPCKYFNNILAGFFVCLIISMLFLGQEWSVGDEISIWCSVLLLFFLQFVKNVKCEQVKSIKYIIVTEKAEYDTIFEPVKHGKYFYIRVTNEEDIEIKRIQLPEEKIERIEYIIDNTIDKSNKVVDNNDNLEMLEILVGEKEKMVEVNVLISVNASESEKENLSIPRDAIDEFLGIGFAENVYEGNVTFSCMPRAVDPDFMQIIIDLGEIAETTIAWTTIISAVLKFCKKCKGYSYNLSVRKKKGKEEIEIDLDIKSSDDCEKVVKQIRKLLKD